MIAEKSTIATEFNAIMDTFFPGSPPLGWILRTVYPEKWIRLYAQTGGKRYPETTVERSAIHGLFNSICGEVFTRVDDVYISCPVMKYEDSCTRYKQSCINECYLTSHKISTYRDREDEDCTYDVYVTKEEWRAECVFRMFNYIVDDKIMQSLLMSVAGDVVSPYDGGFDLFLQNSNRIPTLKARFAQFLSPRDDGL